MNIAVLACLATLAAVPAAMANPAAQGCITAGAARLAVAHPADCCGGRMPCAQFLSTIVVVKPAHALRA